MKTGTLHLNRNSQAPAQPRSAQACDAPTPAALPSEALLRGEKTIAITHNGALYRLQATRQGKLILTK